MNAPMTLAAWVRKAAELWAARQSSRSAPRRRRRRKDVLCERLECRQLMAVWQVPRDFATLSLAFASAQVQSGDTLDIAPGRYENTNLSISKSVHLAALAQILRSWWAGPECNSQCLPSAMWRDWWSMA